MVSGYRRKAATGQVLIFYGALVVAVALASGGVLLFDVGDGVGVAAVDLDESEDSGEVYEGVICYGCVRFARYGMVGVGLSVIALNGIEGAPAIMSFR
jgi:hypothetical protein